jgi:hypothetical protein
MLKRLFIFTASICFAAAAHATVDIDANGISNLVLAANGTFLAQGDLVRLGYFSSTANLATDNSFADLNAVFTPIGEGLANSGTLTENNNSGQTMDINNVSGAGTFGGAFSGISSTYLPTGTQLYMWVFNSSTASAATQWGIFDAPSWAFPADTGVTNLSLSSSNIFTFRGTANGPNFDLSVIPEPSTVATFALGIGLAGIASLLRRGA